MLSALPLLVLYYPYYCFSATCCSHHAGNVNFSKLASTQFLDNLAAIRRASPLTIKSYTEDLVDFQRFLERQGCDDWLAVTDADVKHYLAEMMRSGKSRATVGRRLAALRGFFKYPLGTRAAGG